MKGKNCRWCATNTLAISWGQKNLQTYLGSVKSWIGRKGAVNFNEVHRIWKLIKPIHSSYHSHIVFSVLWRWTISPINLLVKAEK